MKRQMAPAALSRCSAPPEEGPVDHPAAIMAGGGPFPSAGAGARRSVGGAVIGYTVSYTAAFPEQDGETGFGREPGMPYARAEDGAAVLYGKTSGACAPLRRPCPTVPACCPLCRLIPGGPSMWALRKNMR